jgi:Hsp70 protein
MLENVCTRPQLDDMRSINRVMAVSKSREFRFLPLTIRLETQGGVATPLVLRGTPLPARRSHVFSTASDNQSAVEIKLWLGEAPLVRNNVQIGVFELRNIPKAKAGSPEINVEFEVDKKCGVTGRAKLIGSTLSIERHFDPPLELSDKNIQKLITDASNSQKQDDASLRKVEAINRANTLIREAEERLLSTSSSELSSKIAELGLALDSDDAASIREKSDDLKRLLSSTPSPFDLFFSHLMSPQKSPKPVIRARPQPKQEVAAVSAHAPLLGKIFGGATFTLDPRLCFVLMPFDQRFRPLYDDHLKPVIEEAGLRVERADDIRGAGLITWDIWEHINRARFLIADLTDRNPNVFYELGLAHALSKDVILITQSMDFVPFDVKAIRCIRYDLTSRGTTELTRTLRETIAKVIATA